MTRNALRREADALGIVWCRWCGGEIGQTPDDRGRHLDHFGCKTDDMTNEGDRDRMRAIKQTTRNVAGDGSHNLFVRAWSDDPQAVDDLQARIEAWADEDWQEGDDSA